MARYSACIEMLFPELPFVERVKAALDCGYDAVEFWQWHTKDIPALAATGATFALALVDSAECPEAEAETVKTILREEMEGAASLSVPLTAEAKLGHSWAEAH